MNYNIHIYQSPMTHESRIFKTAKTICGQFDEVILLGIGKNNLPKGENIYENVKIIRSPLLSNKILSFIIYYFWVIGQVFKFKPKVVTIHSLELLPLSIFAKLVSSNIVYDAHELETEKNGMGKLRQFISRVIERIFIRFCDKTVVVGYEISEFYNNRYNLLTDVILNIPYLNKNEFKVNDLFRNEFSIKKEEIIFLYQGLLGEGRGLRILMKAFSKLESVSKKLVFMGYGPLEKEIIKLSENNENVFYKEAVDPERVLSYTQSADFGLSLIENTSLSYYYCLPNKLFEYAQSGIPVIVSENIEMKNIVERNNIGISINNNVDSITKAIEKISFEDKLKYYENILKFNKKFNWESQEEKIKTIYTF